MTARERLAWAFLPPPSCRVRGGAETPRRGSRGKPEASGTNSQDTPGPFSIRLCVRASARAPPLLRDPCDRAELAHFPALLLPPPPPPLHPHPPPPSVNGAEPHRTAPSDAAAAAALAALLKHHSPMNMSNAVMGLNPTDRVIKCKCARRRAPPVSAGCFLSSRLFLHLTLNDQSHSQTVGLGTVL